MTFLASIAFLASIPSPSTGTLDVGPITIHMYGLMLLAGIAACIWLTGVRWVRRGGDWDLIFRVAVWGVGAGIVGARLYHVITSWDELPDEWWGVFAVWEGGLGVWGGIAAGALVGSFIAHRSGASALALLDAAAPGLLVAQAIGRVGNWWNQELFGKPTDLPWGLEIEAARRPDDYLLSETFHPTFLYEGLWNLFAAGVLLLLDRRYRFRPPALFALYVALYTGFRFFLEHLRVDPSKEFAGMRVNAWVALVVFVAAVVFFVWWQLFGGRRRRLHLPERKPEPPPAMAVPRGRVRPRR
ncbi:MAG: prolipoprotein diacylglyceryl transferase [Actinobacteria bacterium]|nr:prolipoprotein diacylglyceryl transferase [Actinomycetota bacterium]